MHKDQKRIGRFRYDEVAVIKGMAARGDKQSDIAVWFSCNQGRINECLRMHEARSAHIPPATALPPPGPYVVKAKAEYMALNEAAAIPVRLLDEINQKLSAIMGALNDAGTERAALVRTGTTETPTAH